MSEWSKSMGNLSWALSLLGLEQLAYFFGMGRSAETPPGGRPAALGGITAAVGDALSPSFRALQQAGERIWEKIHSSLLGPSLDTTLDPLWDHGPGYEAGESTAEKSDLAAAGQAAGWGPMPPIPDIQSPAPPAAEPTHGS